MIKGYQFAGQNGDLLTPEAMINLNPKIPTIYWLIAVPLFCKDNLTNLKYE